MSLNVALDIWGVSSPNPRGVITHIQQYARASHILAQNRLITLIYTGMQDDYRWLEKQGFLQSASFRNFRIPGRLQKPLSRLPFLPLDFLLGKPDIYHSFTLFPFKCRNMLVVGTLFDFVPIRVPEHSALSLALEKISWCQWASKNPHTKWIANSEWTRQDALAIARLKSEQVKVVNLCAEDEFFIRPSKDEILTTMATLGISAPYLLSVNTLNPRKNHQRLLDAWQAGNFANQGWQLVLVGHDAGNPLAEKLRAGVYSGVHWLGYLPRDQQTPLYYGCEALLYPSLYEGFGMSVAEAMVCGKPVLVSHRSPMSDIAADGAILVDPLEMQSIQDGIARLISNNELRVSLGNKNFARRQEFGIQQMATNLLAAYQDCVHEYA